RAPPLPVGTRRALPSAVNVILNFTPDGVAAMNSAPLKNVDRISAGESLVAAAAAAGRTAQATIPAIQTRIAIPLRSRENTTIYPIFTENNELPPLRRDTAAAPAFNQRDARGQGPTQNTTPSLLR